MDVNVPTSDSVDVLREVFWAGNVNTAVDDLNTIFNPIWP